MEFAGFAFGRKKKEAMESPKPVSAALYAEKTFDEAVNLLTRMPEIDEVLVKAGVQRHALSKLETDDDISGALRTRREAVIATPWVFESGTEEHKKFLTEELAPSIEQAIFGAWQAVSYGYSVMEAVYRKTDDGRIGIKSVMVKPMEWFDIRPDGELRYFNPNTGGAEGEKLDQVYKFFVTRSNATWRNPKGEAMLARLYWPWFFRFNAWRFWAQFLERFGQPLLVGKSTNPTSMVAALVQAHQDAVIGIGNGDDVAAIQPATEGGAFKMLEDCIVRRYQKMILGQTLTTDTSAGGGGAYALGAVHADVKEGLRQSDLRLVRATLQRVVNAVCLLNGITEVPRLKFDDGTGLAIERAERDSKLYSIGVRFTEKYFEERYTLRKEDFTLTSEPAALENLDKGTTKGDDAPKNDAGEPVAKV